MHMCDVVVAQLGLLHATVRVWVGTRVRVGVWVRVWVRGER